MKKIRKGKREVKAKEKEALLQLLLSISIKFFEQFTLFVTQTSHLSSFLD